MKKDLHIVCLGGGIGTVNLLRGIKEHSKNITVVVSMADDGGSAGRLRRLYSIPPPGDLINCIAAMSNAEPLMRDLLTFRFSGNRYGGDTSLPGHKLGNLILVALSTITGDFKKALLNLQRMFQTSGKILPSTVENVSIWAKTTTGDTVSREENIDLGRFTGEIEKLYLHPKNPTTPPSVITSLRKADCIVGGPGDLYTTILPVLLVPGILRSIKKSKAKKIFVVNVANKPFETPRYNVADYIQAIIKHCGDPIFHSFLVNTNFSPKIPKKFRYDYVPLHSALGLKQEENVTIIKGDLVDEDFPIYHEPKKLGALLLRNL